MAPLERLAASLAFGPHEIENAAPNLILTDRTRATSATSLEHSQSQPRTTLNHDNLHHQYHHHNHHHVHNHNHPQNQQQQHSSSLFGHDPTNTTTTTATAISSQYEQNSSLATNHNQQATTILETNIRPNSSAISTGHDKLDDFTSFVREYVDFQWLRTAISRHWIELLIISVILAYLLYYFTKISRRPKLIGSKQSKFVDFVRSHLSSTVNNRFQPLIYFWGTNPQTALFGHLQGRESLAKHEHANYYKRQYLRVSDSQYLTSNVDLSCHYGKLKSALVAPKLECAAQVELARLDHNQQKAPQLGENIRMALEQAMRDMSADHKPQKGINQDQEPCRQHHHHHHQQQLEKQTSSVSSVSSHDSGVFASSKMCSRDASGDDATTLGSSGSRSSVSGSLSGSLSSCNEPCTDHSQGTPPLSSRPALDSRDANKPAGESVQGGCRCEARAPKNSRLVINELDLHNGNEHQHGQQEFGQCALDWSIAGHENYHRNKLVALISAGMTTGSDKKYVTDTVATLEREGFECCVFIRRGVGGLKLSSPRFFSPAKWRDFEAAVASVRRQRPGARLISVGFSFGSIELCRYLVMSGSKSLVHAALLVSCPFDPEAGGANMRRTRLNRKIDKYLAKNLAKQLHEALFSEASGEDAIGQKESNSTNNNTETKANPNNNNNSQLEPQAGGVCYSETPEAEAEVETESESCISQSSMSEVSRHPTLWTTCTGSQLDLTRLAKVKSLVDFEDHFNRRLQYYPSREAYADDSRLASELANIETPTLCLSSEDDFMAPARLLPLKQIEQNPNLCMILTKRGGHMAFIDGLVWPKKPYFAQRIIADYMGALRKKLECIHDGQTLTFGQDHQEEDLTTPPSGAACCSNLVKANKTSNGLVAVDMDNITSPVCQQGSVPQ